MSLASDTPVRVLHVDDEPDVADLATTFLEREKAQFETETLTTPTAALERLADGDIDCVVSDYEMPEMDGLQLLRRVREDHPNVPFILFTGKGSEEVASEAISAGVTDYLQKETGTEQYELLANRISNAVAQYRSERRAMEQERILSLLQRLNQVMVTASTREEITAAVTDILAADESYLCAWIGEYDSERNRVVPQTVAGVPDDEVAPQRLSRAGPAADDGIRAVLDAEELTVVEGSDPALAVWTDDAAPIEYDRALLIPITYHEKWLGLLAVYPTTAADITAAERRMFEELAGDLGQALHAAATQETLQRHQSAVESVPEGVFVLDENATIKLVNESAATLIDRTPADMHGEPFPTFVDEGIFEAEIIEWYTETLRELLSAESDREEAWYETEIHPADGASRTVEIHLTLRWHDDTFKGTVGVVRDITERKQREQDLEAAKERYRRLVENAPVPMATYGPNGQLIYVNDAAVNLVAAPDRDALIGTPALEFVHRDDRDVAERRMQQVLDERTATPETELTLVTHSGEEKHVYLTGVPVTYDDAEAGQVVIKDITDQKEREQDLQRQRDRLEEFASLVSHDLRNPLEVLRGRLKLAQEECDSDQLDAALDAQERMQTMIEELLRSARMDDSAAEEERLVLSEIAEDSWWNVQTGEATLVADGDLTFQGDPSRVKELLENLFRNAVDHGASDVTVTIGSLDDAEGFYVADDGSGIPDAERDRVFAHGYTTAESGTGIGLAIVKQVAQTHGWETTLTESADGGARFEFRGTTAPEEGST